MTLIIGAINRRQAVVVSDRRLSFDGQILEEEANKATTLVCRDARLAIAFTGLATFGTFVTRRWLLESLAEAANPHGLVGPMFEAFTKLATAKFASLITPRLTDKLLSVFCAGYVHDEVGPRGTMLLVSNFERLGLSPQEDKPGSEFHVSWIREARPAESMGAVCTAGMKAAAREADLTSLSELVREDKPPGAIVGKAIETVRNAAESVLARNSIGKQCTSIVLPSNPGEPVEAAYHSATMSRVMHSPSHIEARGGEFGIYMIDSPESGLIVNHMRQVVAGPKLGRNQPCWCGSGRKFKRCHGQSTMS
jgi:hypothetical protein